MDLNTYKQKIFSDKKSLQDKNFRVEKILAFLPNTQFSVHDFQPRETTD